MDVFGGGVVRTRFPQVAELQSPSKAQTNSLSQPAIEQSRQKTTCTFGVPDGVRLEQLFSPEKYSRKQVDVIQRAHMSGGISLFH